MHRAVVLLGVTTLLLLGSPPPAIAGTIATGRVEDHQIQADINSRNIVQKKATQGTDDPPPCTYEVIDPAVDPQSVTDDGTVSHLYDDTHTTANGRWYWEFCTENANSTRVRTFWLPINSPIDLAQRVLATTPLPTPVIPMAPNPKTYVNSDTWLWIDPNDWRSVTASASLNSVAVTVVANPVSVAWNSGDPSSSPTIVTCNGPGTPLTSDANANGRSTDCAVRYARTSAGEPDRAFQLTATLQWHVTWTATNGTSGDLGVVSRSASLPIQVGQWQVLNSNPK